MDRSAVVGVGVAPVFDAAAARRRFVDGFAHVVGLDAAVLDVPGTSIVLRDDRAGTGAVACYRVGHRLVLWADPAVGGMLESAAVAIDEGTVPDERSVADLLADTGFEPVFRGEICTLHELPHAVAPPLPYSRRALSADDPSDVRAVRAFVAGCDRADVIEAGLDDIDDFDEVAVNVLVDTRSPVEEIVAYSSAMDWAWDPAFGDIAALVHRDHRGRGLAAAVVTAAIDELLALGRSPLYRYRVDNVGSARLAASLGFRPLARFSLHHLVSAA